MVPPVEVQPCLECSTVFLVLQAEVLLVFDILFLKHVLYIFFIQMWPKNKVSRVKGEVEHHEPLFELYLQCQCYFKCSSLSTACV